MSKSTFAEVVGFVTQIVGMSPDGSSAIQFTVFVPQECVGDPYESEGAWRAGEHEFTLEKVVDNRALVWVSLLRDAMIHRLLTVVQYSYSGVEDPGWGQVVSIEVRSSPFVRGVMLSVEDHVAALTIYEHFAWKDQFLVLDDYTSDDAVLVTLENYPDMVLVLPLRKSNLETKLEQLHLLQRAWDEQFKVKLTYCEIPHFFEDRGYSPIITAVGVQKR